MVNGHLFRKQIDTEMAVDKKRKIKQIEKLNNHLR